VKAVYCEKKDTITGMSARPDPSKLHHPMASLGPMFFPALTLHLSTLRTQHTQPLGPMRHCFRG
jgi:hypothetical protein